MKRFALILTTVAAMVPPTFFTAMAVTAVMADTSAMGTDTAVTLGMEAMLDTEATLDTGATLDTEALYGRMDTGFPHMATLVATATVNLMAAMGEVFESRRLTLGFDWGTKCLSQNR